MAAEHPWMPLYVLDWLEDREVKRMPRAARSMYLDILCHEWIGGPFEDDVRFVADMIGELPRSLAPHWTMIRGRFVSLPGSKLGHEKLESLREEARERSEKASKAAKSRHSRDADALLEPTTRAVQSQSQHSHNTVQERTEETLSSPSAPARESFDLDAVYALYPRKGDGKTKGLERLRTQVRTRETYEQVLQAARHYAEKTQAEQTPLRFIKRFATWCNGNWRDYTDGPHIVAQNGDRKNFREPMAHVAETTEEEL